MAIGHWQLAAASRAAASRAGPGAAVDCRQQFFDHTQTERRADRQTDGQTERGTDKQTDRWANRLTDKLTTTASKQAIPVEAVVRAKCTAKHMQTQVCQIE